MKQLRKLAVVAILFFANAPAYAQGAVKARADRPMLRVVGTVVGFDPSSNLVLGFESLRGDLLLVRVDKVLAGKEKAKYIKIHYQYFPGEPPLPRKMFEHKTQWCFWIKREPYDDYPLRQLLYTEARDESGKVLPPDVRMERVPGMENEQLPPENTILPAYEIRSGNFSTSVMPPNCKYTPLRKVPARKQ
jgi:hypothetical protein